MCHAAKTCSGSGTITIIASRTDVVSYFFSLAGPSLSLHSHRMASFSAPTVLSREIATSPAALSEEVNFTAMVGVAMEKQFENLIYPIGI